MEKADECRDELLKKMKPGTASIWQPEAEDSLEKDNHAIIQPYDYVLSVKRFGIVVW